MASRDATIRVSLKSGSFNSETRKMESRIRVAGRRMGSALSAPMSAGLSAAKKSIAGIGNTLKGTIKTAATLGGTLAAGALIKDAVKIQSLYRNIEFSLSKIPGQLMSWQEVQDLVDTAVDRTGQNAENLANSFHEVFQATGDSAYAAKAMDSIGVAATATGEEIRNLTEASQLMKRKFGISESSINDALAVFIQLTGSGGKSMDELTGRFAVMAGEARQAGMEGKEGLSQLLGTLLLLDESIGEKADPGLKNLFQTLKTGTTQLKRIQKEGRIKIEPEANALDKIKKILASTKARAAAEMTITADARTVFDELAKPFDLAMKEAKEKGLNNAAALDAALQAFDNNIKKASTTTMTWDDILKKQQKRMKDDPSVQFEQAMNRIKKAFTQPKMLNAIGELADKLPLLAEKITWLIDFIANNPITAVGAGVGLKVGGSFLGGMASNMLGGLFSKSGAAGSAIGEVTKSGGGASKGLSALGQQANKGATSLSGFAPKAIGVVAGLGALLVAAEQVKNKINETADQVIGGQEETSDFIEDMAQKRRTTVSVQEKYAQLRKIRERKNLAGESWSDEIRRTGSLNIMDKATKGVMGAFAWITGNEDLSPAAIEARQKVKLSGAETEHALSITHQIEKQLESSGKMNAEWDKLLFDPLKNLDKIMRKFDETMQRVNRTVGKPVASRGPSKVSNPNTPGNADRRG